MLWYILLILVLLYLWWRIKNREFIELSKQLKIGIRPWPLIGHAHLFFGNGVDRMKGFIRIGMEAIKRGGLTSGWLGSYFIVVMTDPDDIDVVAKTNLEKPEIMDFMRDLFGDASIFAKVKVWRPRRKLLAPIFNGRKLNLFVEVFEQNSRKLVERLRAVAGKGAFGFWKHVTSYSMSAVCETTLGVPMDTESEKNTHFLNSFEFCTNIGAERLLTPWLRPNFIFKRLRQYQTFLKCRKILYDYIEEIVHLKKKTLQNDKNKDTKESDLKSVLEMMLTTSGKHNIRLDNIGLREESLALALAGIDTSGVAISYTCILLSRYPDVQKKVYEELREVFGDSDSAVTAEDLPKLKYLEAVIKESLRLHPPIPAIVREVTQRVQLRSGVTLVPGCVIVLHIWGTHRNPQHWGPDADQFRPERFLEDTPRHPAAFIPFSHGHRNCLGYQYAMMSMKTAVATLVRNYRLLPATEPDSEGNYPPLNTEYQVVIRDTEQFQLILEHRKDL